MITPCISLTRFVVTTVTGGYQFCFLSSLIVILSYSQPVNATNQNRSNPSYKLCKLVMLNIQKPKNRKSCTFTFVFGNFDTACYIMRTMTVSLLTVLLHVPFPYRYVFTLTLNKIVVSASVKPVNSQFLNEKLRNSEYHVL